MLLMPEKDLTSLSSDPWAGGSMGVGGGHRIGEQPCSCFYQCACCKKPSQPGTHCFLSRSPGTLHESLLHSTYHCLPCFIVIYVCVCLPKETVSCQSREQGLCALCLPSPVSDRMLWLVYICWTDILAPDVRRRRGTFRELKGSNQYSLPWFSGPQLIMKTNGNSNYSDDKNFNKSHFYRWLIQILLFHWWSHLITIIALRSRYYDAHFINEKSQGSRRWNGLPLKGPECCLDSYTNESDYGILNLSFLTLDW